MSRRIRILCIAISILGAAWAGYTMYHRTGEQLLWGHRPLLLFIAFWVLVQGLLVGRKNGATGWRQMGLSSLSGLLLGLGFPGIVPAPLLMFIGFVPLLLLESEISGSEGKGKGRRVFLHSYNAFLLWNILSTWWVANTALAAGIVAMALNSLFMALVFTAFHHTKHRMPRIAGAAFMSFWMAFEYLHLNWEITWPWLTLGNAFAQFPALVQWYEFTGVFGGSLWILAGNWLIFKAWKQRDDRAALRSSVLKTALWLLVPLAVSLWQYFSYKEQGDKTVQVALVQPNYEPHYEKFDIPEDVQMQRFLELSASITDSNTDYLVWPETSFGYVETRSVESYPAVVQLRGFMAKFPQLKVIAGIDAYHIFLPGEPHSKAVRSSSSGGGTMFFEVLNAAAQFSNESEEVQLYRKSKLVPGPEILPYRRFFGIFEPVINQVQGTVEGVGTQKERTSMSSSSARMAPVICYESIFGEFFTGYIHKGAQAAVIMTNDGWWDNSPGHRQHLWLGTLRAVETRRSIARAANTGISAFINQRGDILQPTRYNEAVAIKGTVRLNGGVTFYVRWGDLIARIAVFTTLLLLLNTISKSIQERVGK